MVGERQSPGHASHNRSQEADGVTPRGYAELGAVPDELPGDRPSYNPY